MPSGPWLVPVRSSSQEPARAHPASEQTRPDATASVTSYPVTARIRARAVGSRPTTSNTTLRCLPKRTRIPTWPGFAEGERERGASASGPLPTPSLSSCPELGFQDPPRRPPETPSRTSHRTPGAASARAPAGLTALWPVPSRNGELQGRRAGLIVSCPRHPAQLLSRRRLSKDVPGAFSR